MSKRGRWLSHPKNKADYKSGEAPDDDEQMMGAPTSEVVENANGYKEGCKLGTVDWVDRIEDVPPGKDTVYKVADGTKTILETLVEKVDLVLCESAELRQRLFTTEVRLEDTQARLEDTQARLDDTQARLDDTQARLDDTQARLDDTQASLTTTETRLQESESSLQSQINIQSELFSGPLVYSIVIDFAQLFKEMEEASIKRRLPNHQGLFDENRVTRILTAFNRLNNEVLQAELRKDPAIKKLLEISGRKDFMDFIDMRNEIAHCSAINMDNLDKTIKQLGKLKIGDDNKRKFELVVSFFEELKRVPYYKELKAIYSQKNNITQQKNNPAQQKQ